MTASTLAKLESELADIFRKANLAIPKKPATLNAITHGLSGQKLIFTAQELPQYAKMGLDYMLECRPVGVRETGNAQLMFEGRWRLHRMLAIARGVDAFCEEARNIHLNMDFFSRYETRIVRNGSRLNAELKKLQKDRARRSPGLVFDEASNPAIDWYRRLLARCEELAKERQGYEDYEAAQRARTVEKSAEAGADQAASAAPRTSFRRMPPRAIFVVDVAKG